MPAVEKPNYMVPIQQIINKEGLVVIIGGSLKDGYIKDGRVSGSNLNILNNGNGFVGKPIPFYSESGKMIAMDYMAVSVAGSDGGIANGIFKQGKEGISMASFAALDYLQ